jgi:hypothetical protein
MSKNFIKNKCTFYIITFSPMENLFEKIPHAQQVQNCMNQAVQEKLQAFLTRIVRVMETMDTKTVTIPAQGDGILLCGLHAERIK